MEIMKELQKPFAPDELEWRVGSTNKEKTKGLALPYVTNRAIQNRLDHIFGCFGWKNEYKEWKGQAQLCGISILHEGEWITKWDGADDSNMEGTKGGLSDAMKRAAYQWGIGRYLYKMPTKWMSIKAQGKSYVLESTPEIPKEFLPKEYVPKKTFSNDKPKETKPDISRFWQSITDLGYTETEVYELATDLEGKEIKDISTFSKDKLTEIYKMLKTQKDAKDSFEGEEV